MPVLTLSGLSRAFGKVTAVDNVDLRIADGEFVSLLGPSGCGKTTTLRMIAGFIDPTGGTIEVDGKVLSSTKGSLPPEKRGMSMIFQSYAIWPNMTVGENVAFGLKLRKLASDEVKSRVQAILGVVQMTHLIDRYPAELSGGQQQRVALARAIVVQPSVLLLDEPLSNLDANLREEMRFEIRRLHDEFKITTVYVTHDQAEAMATSDRIAVMNQGRIEQVDDPHTLYTKPRRRFVAGFIGRTNFVSGKREAGTVRFDGFSVDAGRLDGSARTGAELLYSVRPQNLRLTLTAPEGGVIAVPGSVAERTFLGEHWDYVFAVGDSGARLRVSAPAHDVHAVGTKAWLAIDPALMVPID